MRRWNGWGDDATSYPLPESAARYLAALIGDGSPTPDASLAPAVPSGPPARLPAPPPPAGFPAEAARALWDTSTLRSPARPSSPSTSLTWAGSWTLITRLTWPLSKLASAGRLWRP